MCKYELPRYVKAVESYRLTEIQTRPKLLDTTPLRGWSNMYRRSVGDTFLSRPESLIRELHHQMCM